MAFSAATWVVERPRICVLSSSATAVAVSADTWVSFSEPIWALVSACAWEAERAKP